MEVVIGPGGAAYEKGKVKRGAIQRLMEYSEKNYAGDEIDRVSAALATVVASEMESTFDSAPAKDKETLAEYNNGFVKALLAIPEWTPAVLDILEENRKLGEAWFAQTKGLEKTDFKVWWDGMVAEAVAARLWKKTVGGSELIQDAKIDAQGLDFYDVIEMDDQRVAVGLQVKSKAAKWPDQFEIYPVFLESSLEGAYVYSADSRGYREKMLRTLDKLQTGGEVDVGTVLKIELGVKGNDGWRTLMSNVESRKLVAEFRQELEQNLRTLLW